MEMLQGKAGQKLQPTSSLANLSKLRGLLEPSQSPRSISVYSRKFPASSPKCLRQSSHDFPMSKNTPDPLILKSGLFRLKELDKYLFSNDLVTLEEIIFRQQRYRQQATQSIPYLKIMLTKQVLAGYFCHKNKQWEILGSLETGEVAYWSKARTRVWLLATISGGPQPPKTPPPRNPVSSSGLPSHLHSHMHTHTI